ncbi:MAG: Maff2 family protein [Defluviitaleaceae bacterium]|nr:Maff2 family protein [Defluviitaleaceae bacterium]
MFQQFLSNTGFAVGITLNPNIGVDMWNTIVDVLQTLVVAGGGALGAFGAIKLFDGQGEGDGSKVSQGRWQLIGGIGIIVVGFLIIPMLGDLF